MDFPKNVGTMNVSPTLVFWIVYTSTKENPQRNVVWCICNFLRQCVNMDFARHHLKHHTIDVYSVAFHPHLPLLATGSADNTVILYNIERL